MRMDKIPTGLFYLEQSWLGKTAEDWKRLLPVFQRLVVVRCEMLWTHSALEITAISDLFDLALDGYPAERYEVLVKLSPMCNIIEVKAVKTKETLPTQMQFDSNTASFRCYPEGYSEFRSLAHRY